jgi:hypothetical protein
MVGPGEGAAVIWSTGEEGCVIGEDRGEVKVGLGEVMDGVDGVDGIPGLSLSLSLT